MKIRRANKKDFEEYYHLKNEDFKEYSKLIGAKITSTKKESKKEFDRILSSKEDFLFFAEENEIIGFLHGTIKRNTQGKANIEYLYVKRNYRKKGIAKELIKTFTNFAIEKKAKRIFLKVSINNLKAINLYKKLNFKMIDYFMVRYLK